MSQSEKKVALFLADGCEEIEAITVVDLLYRAGIPCTTVSITDHTNVTSSHKVTVIADTTISQIDFSDYDMIVLPGGMPGTTNLENCKPLTEAVIDFYSQGRQIAAICAAPTILAHLGLLDGRKATCNPGRYDDLIRCGADLTKEPVTVSENIITSQAMGTAISFGLAIVAHYQGQAAADALEENIVHR